MKIFAKVLAVLAVLLVLLSLFALILVTVFQVPVCEVFFLSSMTRRLEKYPVVLGGTILAMVLQLLFTVPMVFLAGRKKGGIWIEIALVLLMVLTVPITKMVGDFLSWFFICGIRYAKQSFDLFYLFDRYYLWFSLSAAYSGLPNLLPVIKVWMEWLCAPAEVAMVLTFVVSGISAGLRLKAKKERKQAKMSAPQEEAVCEWDTAHEMCKGELL